MSMIHHLAKRRKLSDIVEEIKTLEPSERNRFMENPESVLLETFAPKKVDRIIDIVKTACEQIDKSSLKTTRDTGGTWSLPKGIVRRGEEYLTAALRETEEETGIKRDAFRILTDKQIIIVYQDKNGWKYRLVFFIALMEHHIKETETYINTAETDKLKWVPLSDVTCYLPREYANKFMQALRTILHQQLS